MVCLYPLWKVPWPHPWTWLRFGKTVIELSTSTGSVGRIAGRFDPADNKGYITLRGVHPDTFDQVVQVTGPAEAATDGVLADCIVNEKNELDSVIL